MSQLKIRNGNDWYSVPAGGAGVPSGGSAGQLLMKSSSTDYATEWINNINEVIDLSNDLVITKSSGSDTVNSSSCTAYRSGNLIQIGFSFTSTATVSAGSNSFVGTLSGIPLPIHGINIHGYQGDSIIAIHISTTGGITARVVGGDKGSSGGFGCTGVYICATGSA